MITDYKSFYAMCCISETLITHMIFSPWPMHSRLLLCNLHSYPLNSLSSVLTNGPKWVFFLILQGNRSFFVCFCPRPLTDL